MEPIYYASGTNKPGEVRGMARAGRNIGVEADACLQRRCEAALLEVGRAYPAVRLFIDSGAFGEVGVVQGKIVVKKPITIPEWERRLALMERVGTVYGSRLLIMAPDRIGDQAETLRRLRWFRASGWLERFRRSGVEIAVVLQGGELDPVAFERAAAIALGWDGYTIAFPMRKGATPLPRVVDFVRRRSPRRVHLLGIGPSARKEGNKPSAAELRRFLFDAFPEVRWSWDSSLIRQSVGRKDPRAYTMAQDLEREGVHLDALAGQVKFARGPFALDFTDMAAFPSLYLFDLWGAPALNKCVTELQAKPRRADTPAGRRTWRARKAKWDKCRAAFRRAAMRTAKAAGLSGLEAEQFIDDPDGFTARGNRLVEDPRYAMALEEAFDAWTRKQRGGPPEIAQLIAERATYRAFRPEGLDAGPAPRQGGQQLLRGFE